MSHVTVLVLQSTDLRGPWQRSLYLLFRHLLFQKYCLYVQCSYQSVCLVTQRLLSSQRLQFKTVLGWIQMIPAA